MPEPFELQPGEVSVVGPDGEFHAVPEASAAEATRLGGRIATPAELREARFGGAGGALGAAAIGAANTLTLGGFTAAQAEAGQLLGGREGRQSIEDTIRNIEQTNPIATTLGEVAPLLFVPEAGGEEIASGLIRGESAMARAARFAAPEFVRGAAETAFVDTGHGISEDLLDHDLAAESFYVHALKPETLYGGLLNVGVSSGFAGLGKLTARLGRQAGGRIGEVAATDANLIDDAVRSVQAAGGTSEEAHAAIRDMHALAERRALLPANERGLVDEGAERFIRAHAKGDADAARQYRRIYREGRRVTEELDKEITGYTVQADTLLESVVNDVAVMERAQFGLKQANMQRVADPTRVPVAADAVNGLMRELRATILPPVMPPKPEIGAFRPPPAPREIAGKVPAYPKPEKVRVPREVPPLEVFEAQAARQLKPVRLAAEDAGAVEAQAPLGFGKRFSLDPDAGIAAPQGRPGKPFDVGAMTAEPESLAARVVKLQDSTGMTSVPDLVRAMGGEGARERVHAELLKGYREGLFELRPESGMGRLSKADLALAMEGPQGSRLSYIRYKGPALESGARAEVSLSKGALRKGRAPTEDAFRSSFEPRIDPDAGLRGGFEAEPAFGIGKRGADPKAVRELALELRAAAATEREGAVAKAFAEVEASNARTIREYEEAVARVAQENGGGTQRAAAEYQAQLAAMKAAHEAEAAAKLAAWEDDVARAEGERMKLIDPEIRRLIGYDPALRVGVANKDLKAIEKLVLDMEREARAAIRVGGAEGHARLATLADDSKRIMGRYAKFGTENHAAAKQLERYFYENRLKPLLEDSNLWGEPMASMQARTNASFHASFEAVTGARNRFMGSLESPNGERLYTPKGATKGFIEKLGTHENGFDEQLISRLTDAARTRGKAMVETMELPAPVRASIERAAKNATELEKLIEKARVTAHDAREIKAIKAREASGGGGGILGKLMSFATSPARALETLASFRKAETEVKKLISRDSKGFLGGEAVPNVKPHLDDAERKAALQSLADIRRYQTEPRTLALSIKGLIGDMPETSPQMASAVAHTVARGALALAKRAPQPLPPRFTDKPGEDRYASGALEKYWRDKQLVEKPRVVLQLMRSGQLHQEDVVLMQEVVPRLFAQMQMQLDRDLLEARQKGELRTLSYQEQIALSWMLGRPLDASQTADFVAAMQRSAANDPMNQAAYGKSAMGGGRPSNLEKINLERYSTLQERMEE